MARLARLVIPGLPHHVTHRGNRRADIFVRPEDQSAYLSFLSEYAARAELKIWAYCLMTNHVHLIVLPEHENSMARGVGLAHRRYATWINQRENWSGHLWANRYFSTPLDDAHHYAAVRYVECNPVRAGVVAQAAQYAWSSARAHCGSASDHLLDQARPYAKWGIEDWAAWLSEPEETEVLLALRRCTASGRPCGGAGFIAQLEQRLARMLHPAKRGRKPMLLENVVDPTGDMFA